MENNLKAICETQPSCFTYTQVNAIAIDVGLPRRVEEIIYICLGAFVAPYSSFVIPAME